MNSKPCLIGILKELLNRIDIDLISSGLKESGIRTGNFNLRHLLTIRSLVLKEIRMRFPGEHRSMISLSVGWMTVRQTTVRLYLFSISTSITGLSIFFEKFVT